MTKSSLNRVLRETDTALLPTLAQVWGVPYDSTDERWRETLATAMTDAARAENVWDALDDKTRGALQALIGAGGRMPEKNYTRLYGEIRRMGMKDIQREDPLRRPKSASEALFYRGLIHLAYEHADTGARTVLFVPDDMLRVLPTHKTGFTNLKDEPIDFPDDEDASPEEEAEEAAFDDADAMIEPLEEVRDERLADTSLVDDLATLLAYLQIVNPPITSGILAAEDENALRPFLLNDHPARFRFLVQLALIGDVIEVQNGRAYPNRTNARRWLSLSRVEQVQAMAEVWRNSELLIDLALVPGLYPEMDAGTLHQYNPAAARAAVFEMMNTTLPLNGWWPLEDFIETVREDSPDFQRPNGDFSSWYIRDSSGAYLSGIENWDAVDGAYLEYLLHGPMHWLGLLDLAQDAARLNVFGRAVLTRGRFPQQPDPQEKITVEPNGTVHVSRKVSRFDRFQIARFSSWGATGKEYSYQLDAEGIQRGAAQGITVGHIASFLQKMSGEALPDGVNRLLENWRGGPASKVSFERAIILRTTAPETLDLVLENPATRRFMGARLGPMAAVIRDGQENDLRAALGTLGVQVEMA